jgi:hypothetical protein
MVILHVLHRNFEEEGGRRKKMKESPLPPNPRFATAVSLHTVEAWTAWRSSWCRLVCVATVSTSGYFFTTHHTRRERGCAPHKAGKQGCCSMRRRDAWMRAAGEAKAARNYRANENSSARGHGSHTMGGGRAGETSFMCPPGVADGGERSRWRSQPHAAPPVELKYLATKIVFRTHKIEIPDAQIELISWRSRSLSTTPSCAHAEETEACRALAALLWVRRCERCCAAFPAVSRRRLAHFYGPPCSRLPTPVSLMWLVALHTSPVLVDDDPTHVAFPTPAACCGWRRISARS